MLSTYLKEKSKEPVSKGIYLTPVLQNIIQLVQNVEKKMGDKFHYLYVRKSVDKGTRLLSPGEISQKFWYLEDGIMGEFIERNNRKYAVAFCFPNEFVDEFVTSGSQSPTELIIEMISDGVVWEFDWDTIHYLENEMPQIKEMERLLKAAVILENKDRILQCNFFTAQERYFILLKRGQQLIQKIPSAYIADYIDTSPETLSRIRAKIGDVDEIPSCDTVTYLLHKEGIKKRSFIKMDEKKEDDNEIYPW